MIICARNTSSADCYEALLELETRYCRQEPYITLGRYIHVTGAQTAEQG
ncbi:metallothionein SmtA [Escherichia coli]|nr:metallothionein SmtA [Escherichia coli]